MKAHTMNLSVRLCACLAAAALLSGCASFSADGGFSSVQQITKERLAKELHWARTDADQNAIDTRVTALLAQPLSADAAVQLALLNNRGLQASFEDLGIGEAELVQATRLPNPGFSFSRLNRNGELEIERGLHVDLARLLLLPLTGPLERRRFEQTQGMVALSVLTLAADVRRAYFQAVAGQETLRYTRQVRDAAEASAELARRMAQVGNFNKLQRAREQGFYADAMLNVARAEQAAHASRERLTRLLGLWGTQSAFMLPERLPELPKVVMDQPDIERIALAQRLDVQSAKLTAELTAKQLGLTRRTGFINVFELGPRSVSASGATTLRGWEVTVELPLFDWGQAKVARAPKAPTSRRCTVRQKRPSTHAPRCARPIPPTARRTTSHATTSKRSCRCASSSPTKTCCATTAC